MNEPIVTAEVCDPVEEQRPTASTILDNGWAIVGLLFVVGPLGLPALWFSRRFSWKVKLAGTIGLLLLTFVLPAALIWYLYATAIGPVIDALAG